MGYRVFKDSNGNEWQAWDVVPQLAERRLGDRRHLRMPPPVGERRSRERRTVSGRRPMLTAAGLNGGWLCFEASIEKRRLTPIPGDWLACGEDQLRQYLREAKPAIRPATSVDIAAQANRRH